MDENLDLYLTAGQVCTRFGGISDMTLWRWSHNPDLRFPKPIYIQRIRYWRRADLEAWEASRAQQAA